MKRYNKSLVVPTVILCTAGWGFFASEAIKQSGKAEEIPNYTIENDKQISEPLKDSHQAFYDEYERLKEEERKRLEELERQRLLKLEQERLAELARIEAEKKKQREIAEAKKKVLTSNNEIVYNNNSGGWVNSQLTHYQAYCSEGCTGKSASGIFIGNSIYYKGYRIVATSKQIPLFSILQVEYPDGTSFKAVVLDRGGAINHTGILDVLVNSDTQARKLGRQNGRYKIIGSLNNK